MSKYKARLTTRTSDSGKMQSRKKKCENLLRERDILRGVLLGASPASECVFPIGIEVVSTTWFPGTTPRAPYRKSIKKRGEAERKGK